MSVRARPFQVRFWGVRGSIPTPGVATRLVGGNTSCVEIRAGDEVVILDAGSGVRALGEKLAKEGVRKATFLFSHVHWDHILGFPYFRPAANSANEFTIFGERKAGTGIDEILSFQAEQSHAPIVVPEKGARVRFEEVKPGDTFKVGSVSITTARMNHPDGCVAFRVEQDGHSVVYATDTEHYEEGTDPALTKLSQGGDALIYDAMYTSEEYRGEVGGSKKGWGHSTWQDGVRLAKDAGVKRFVLFHHEPSHDDRFVARVEKQARALHPGSIAAREQMVLDLVADRVQMPKAPSPVLVPRRAVAKKAKRRPARRAPAAKRRGALR